MRIPGKVTTLSKNEVDIIFKRIQFWGLSYLIDDWEDDGMYESIDLLGYLIVVGLTES